VDELIEELRRKLGDERIMSRQADLFAYSLDAAPGEMVPPKVVVRPASTEDVSAVLSLCNRGGVPVVFRGAGTSLCGSSTPVPGCVLLDFRGMDRVLEVDADDRLVVTQPGIAYAALNRALAPHGLFFPPDPSSGEACTIGGMVASNSSGMGAVKYGVTADYVRQLKVVLADGESMRIGTRAEKSAAGPDLCRLFVGSEGTLGAVTEVTLHLRRLPQHHRTLLAGFSESGDAATAAIALVLQGELPCSLEYMDGTTLELVRQATGLDHGECGALLLVEYSGHDAGIVETEERHGREILSSHGPVFLREACDDEERESLWEARRAAYPAMMRASTAPLIGDVVVPVSKFAGALAGFEAAAKKHGVPTAFFGHVGDGNIHPVTLTDEGDLDAMRRAQLVHDEIVELAQNLGGTSTGEHGIGTHKNRFLAAEYGGNLRLLRELKRVLDPKGILNPGTMEG